MSNARLDALKQWRESGSKAELLTPWEKLRRKNTRKAAIDAKCHECMGWEENAAFPGGIRANIKACTATGCPLHGWRPYK